MNILRNMLRGLMIALSITLVSGPAHAQVSERMQAIIEAYGGEAALRAVTSVEYDWSGYYIARYQSRYTEPPYNRLPIRNWGAFDLETERAVTDSISTWPGELQMGMRTVVDGESSWTLNTISQIYDEGAYHGYSSIKNGAAQRMPFLLVQNMLDHADRFEWSGETVENRGITYDVITYNGLTLWVHPETSLIYALQTRGGNMTDVEVEVLRVFDHYFEQDGVMVNRRYQVWSDIDETSDMELYALRFNVDVTPYLEIPSSFVEVESMDGYNGNTEITVEQFGEGVYLAGDGETRILYVELDDYFVAMEAGGMPFYAEATYEAMQPYMHGKPLRYIIPTHHHDDHAVAIHFYARIGATILTTRDKEGFLRRLLARSWDDEGPVTDAAFEFLDEPSRLFEDRFNVIVYQDAPHTENMLVGYVPGDRLFYGCDIFIGWAGDDGRQGAPYSVRHLMDWIADRQAEGMMGEVDQYLTCHGRPLDAAQMAMMLNTERTAIVLPNNESWTTANWFERYGLTDDTVGNPRRTNVMPGPSLH